MLILVIQVEKEIMLGQRVFHDEAAALFTPLMPGRISHYNGKSCTECLAGISLDFQLAFVLPT